MTLLHFGRERAWRLRALAGAWACVATVPLAPLQPPVDAAREPHSSYVVIVHPDNPLTSIDRETLSRIFLKRMSNWPDGNAAVPVDLRSAESSRIAFSERVHRKPVGAVRAYWQQQIFSGRDVPPTEKVSEEDVVAFVAGNRGAVGYVSAGVSLVGVKAIQVTGAEP